MGGEMGPVESSNAEFIEAKPDQVGFFSLNTSIPSFAGAILEGLSWCWWSTLDLPRHKQVLNLVPDIQGGSPGV